MDTKQKALNMLAKGRTTAEVAKRCGVSQPTVQRWIKSDGVSNPVHEVCEQVVHRVSLSVESIVGDELKVQALQLLRLSGKSLNCLEEIIDNPDTRTADRLKACQIVGDWVNFQGLHFQGGGDLLTHTLNKYGLEIAITPDGEKTLQRPIKRYPLKRDYEFVFDSHGQTAGIRKTLD
jgi:transcriptional regulator with XRE-family HTH domain